MGLKPTGLTTYASNLMPALPISKATLLVSSHQRFIESKAQFDYYTIPDNLTSEYGTKGHLRRLLWTQFQLPCLYKKLRSPLLFSPIPEAPLFSGCRFVVMVHDLIPLHFSAWKSPLKYYFQYYVPQVLRQAVHIICNSQATAQDIVDFYGISAQKITPIWLAHDVNHFHFLDLPTKNYFIYIGRSDPYKNLQRSLQAFAELTHVQEYEFWIVGPRDQRFTPNLEALVNELGIASQVKFLDYVPYAELPKIINQAIALVFPSLWEGFGLPVLEAMACGTPVITSNLASMPEVAGEAALLVDPYNTAELTAAMQAIATDLQLRSRLCQASLTRASQFNWAKTATQTSQVLKSYL
ncbi:glycosyltransferase family 4 protein [Oscillatoria sp. FACHB-1407]|uniref:glycosyltransferase family 4 protein n=1 Tax=Oscillatoria sp. FACHB-1407 TaxID=2692847 RepID=UPI0016825183|nr:glycosyltransferase family 1 protein [Oscillatoria sp. FACHB-1407]MBD2462785.1 glycosyltransferase family 4 protein [Oscillatoria sp. FACHB-1407]